MSSAQLGSNQLGISGKSLKTLEKSVSNQRHGVPLSTVGEAKTMKYALQRRAGSILHDHGKAAGLQHPTCWCNRGVANASDRIAVKRTESNKSGRLHGTTTCKNVWTCPVCSAKICAVRQVELFDGMKNWIGQGGYVYLITLTFPHERGMPLADLVKKFIKARTHFKNSGTYKRILAKGVRKGSVSSLEITFGDEHGWHPHNHDLLFATSDAFGVEKRDGEQLTDDERRADKVKMTKGENGCLSSRLIDELKAAWYMALLKAGLCDKGDMTKVLEHGLDVRGGQHAAEYIAKFGKEQKWGLSREATMHACKTGTKKDGEYHGAHPFQLLAWAEGGDGAAVEQFREYAEAFKSKRMLSWSPGLKKELLGVDDDSDEEAADRDMPEELDIGTITSEALSILHKRRLLGNFLGYVGEYCSNPETWQEDIDAYLSWAKTLTPTARGEVKVKMWSRGSELEAKGSRGFMFIDKEMAHG